MQLSITAIRTDGGTQPREEIDLSKVGEYAERMADGDIFKPIVVFHDGADYWLADGFHRLAAAQQLGLAEIAADVRQGTLQDAQWYSYGANKDHGIQRKRADIQRAVRGALTHPYVGRHSDDQIARHCGVSRQTIWNYRQTQDASCKSLQDTRLVTRNGTTYEMNTAAIGNGHKPAYEVDNDWRPIDLPIDAPPALHKALSDYYSNENAEFDHPDVDRFDPAVHVGFDDGGMPIDDSGMTDDQYHGAHRLEDLARDLGLEIEIKPISVPATPDPTGLQGPARALLSSALNGGSNEWYTPAEYADRARAFMGSIDLDPASCKYANDNGVRATKIWTQDDDGLAQPWRGNVWCNPPYGKQVPAWIDRIITAYTTREINACCALVNATTDVQWFQRLWDFPICFLEGRVPFYNDKGVDPAPTHGSVIVYFGEDIAGFASSFSDIGHVVVPAGLYGKVL